LSVTVLNLVSCIQAQNKILVVPAERTKYEWKATSLYVNDLLVVTNSELHLNLILEVRSY